MTPDKKLNDKQKQFCEEYLIDLNATKAAIRAGYSKKTAQQIGSENLLKLVIQNYITELKEKRNKRVQVSQDEVLNHLNILRKSRIDEYVILKTIPIDPEDDDLEGLTDGEIEDLMGSSKVIKYKQVMEFKDFDDLTDKQLMCIESVKMGRNGMELKLHGKDWTIEKINRHIGFYEKDNNQQKNSYTVTIGK